MKLLRFGDGENEKPGVVLADGIRLDVSAFGQDYNELFFEQYGIEKLAVWLDKNRDKCWPIGKQLRLASPVCRPSKIICVGLNYIDHVKESGMKLPREPVIFFKATSALCGPDDNLVIPKNSTKTDWEVELAVIMGKQCVYADERESESCIAGYALHNDYSERAFQLEKDGQWVKGKSCDTFAPLGPYLVTPDEIDDVNNLDMWLKVNGEIKQQSNTKHLVFKIPFLISYISQFMTLLPGDIISTGTPGGVGLGLNPPQYLKAGDIVELGIEGLGMQKQCVVGWKSRKL